MEPILQGALHSESVCLSEVSKGHCAVSSPILLLLYDDQCYRNMISRRSDTLHIFIVLMNMAVFSPKEVRFKMFSKCFLR